MKLTKTACWRQLPRAPSEHTVHARAMVGNHSLLGRGEMETAPQERSRERSVHNEFRPCL